MDGTNSNRKYEAFKIPGRQQNEDGSPPSPAKASEGASLEADAFYEIEYDSCPIPGVGKFVLKPQKIETAETDEIRGLFGKMRDIAREHRSALNYSRFFDRRVHYENTLIFYKQGLFMKDFTDDYEGSAPFSQYFPYYQMMGYEQLRTYFTWRTRVREGKVSDTSLSYAFLYIYELLNNIGVKDPQDGLDKLTAFWDAFRGYHKAIDKYVVRWLKDYHIYYQHQLPRFFQKFVEQNRLTEYYPPMTNSDDPFELFCGISSYDIRKSAFFTDETSKLVTECFCFVLDRLRQILSGKGIPFDESVFQPSQKISEWKPFRDALFYNWIKQPDRRIVLSKNEIYICKQNKWEFSTVITSPGGRQLIGYIMKQMEADLRKAVKYKYKLTANLSAVQHELSHSLEAAGLSLKEIISSAVAEFYREATKTVVRVDPRALSAIREEALITQQRLIVEEQEEPVVPVPAPQAAPTPPVPQVSLLLSEAMPPFPPPSASDADVWEKLKASLSETDLTALTIILDGGTTLRQFADERGMMLEVLVDGINEKAMDAIGDSLIDDEFVLYEDYINQVKELVK